MNSMKINCSRETKPGLHIVSSQNEEISKLKKKLETHDAIVTERNELLEICEQIVLWKKKLENGYEKGFIDLKNMCNVQQEKLKKAISAEYEYDLRLRELQNYNTSMINQLKNHKLNNNTLQSKLAESVQIIKRMQEEHCRTSSELDEKNREAKQLKVNLKSKEDELSEMCRQLDICRKNCDRLKELNGILDVDFKFIKTKLDEAKESATLAEKNFTLERETLSNELKIKCEILSERETEYDKALCEINDEKCKVRELMKTLEKVGKESKRNQDEMKNQIRKLQRENCSNDDLKNKYSKLQKENEFNIMEINAQNKRLEEKECQLKKMSLLSEENRKLKQTYDDCCCSKLEAEKDMSIDCNDVNAKSIVGKYSSTKETNIVNENTELSSLNCELETLKKDVGIYFKT